MNPIPPPSTRLRSLRWVSPAVAAWLLVAACTPAERPLPERPNVVILYADDVGYGDVGAYGSQLIRTTRIDRLAEQGIRFTDAYAAAATCTPSRYSLLTGRYAFRNPRAQVLPGDAPLLIRPGTPTLASILRSAGYATAVVGKWHLGLGDGDLDWNGPIRPGPLEIGFDLSFLLPATNDRVPTVYVDGHHVRGLSPDDPPLRVGYDGPIGSLPTGRSHPELLHYPADDQHSGTIVHGISRIGFMDGGQSAWWRDDEMAMVFAERAVDFIGAHRDRPFLLFLSMHQNHVPRWPHPDFVGASETGLRGDTVHELDWVVGEIVGALERHRLTERTLVLFTSDNGPVFFDGYEDGALENARDHRPSGPFRGGKYVAYEGGTRVPFIVSWPGVVESMVSDAVISQVDLVATLAALAGAEVPSGAAPDSRNLLPALLGRTTAGRDQVVQQSSDGLALRRGPWKYVAAGNRSNWAYDRHNLGETSLNVAALSPEEYLFNLDEDPGETTSLANERPDLLEELRALLERERAGTAGRE